ncbi:MAG: phosphatase PAP2 family protein [Solirubrobacterales bacterium]
MIEGLPIRDPDARYVGSPLALIAVVAAIFLLLDLIPRTWSAVRRDGVAPLASIRNVFRDRWWGRRGLIVVGCLLSFYITYLSYRNLKSYIPFVTDANHDLGLLDFERGLFFGHDPAAFLHDILGTGIAAHVLSFAYLAFLTFVPISLAAALIWSRRLLPGLWYVTTLSLAWLLGALSYYLIPALGPIFARPALFAELPETGVFRLQEKLVEHRAEVLADPAATNAVQSIAAFASLHTAVVFSAALIAQLTGAPRPIRIGLWVFLGLTELATVYFGWHYVVDDLGGLAIGAFAVWAGARLTGIELRPLARLRRVPQTRAMETQ